MKSCMGIRGGAVVVVLLALATAVWLYRGTGTDMTGKAPGVTAEGCGGTAAGPTAAPPSGVTASSDASNSSARFIRPDEPAVAPARSRTRTASPLSAAGEGLIEPLEGGVKNRYAQNKILDERTSPPDTNGQYERVRIVKTSMKYPLVRVVEKWQERGAGSPSSDTLLSQTAMVADHVTLKVKEGATEAQLAAYAQAHGGTILRKMRVPGPGTYLVKFDTVTVDTVPNAVAALSQPAAPVDYVNPDYVVYTLETIPNDPLFSQLYGMHNTGQIASTGTVASATNTVSGTAIAYSPVTPGVTGTLYHCGLGNPGDFPAGVSNNIALIQRGTLTFADKAANAQAKGAKAVILYNNISGAFSGTFSKPGDWPPSMGISDTDGARLLTQTNTSVTVAIHGSKVDADIDAPEAWDISTGSTNVLVAVIDTGIDYTHPDLRSNMWVNPAPGSGGYTNDLYGYDFYNNDSDPMDDHFHGTHCAGTIGGVGNNGIGVAGVCWNVRLMALKFLSAEGGGVLSDAIEAIYYATAKGARLTSNSWGGGGFDQGMLDAINNAGASNILFVAAAGNSSGNNDASPTYPGSYNSSNIIAVAATDNNDLLASFSCYGQNSVDLGAPGVSILSTFPTTLTTAMTKSGLSTNYASISGTSMATPHVAGACALMAAAHPTLSATTIKTLIMAQTDQIPALAGKCVTGGRLNIGNAIRLTSQPVLRLWGKTVTDPAPGGNGDGRVNPGETAQIAVKLMNASTNAATNVTATISITHPYITVVSNTIPFGDIQGLSEKQASNAFVFTVGSDCPPQLVTFQMVTSDGAGNAWTNLLPVRVRGMSKISGTVRFDGGPGIGFKVICYGQDVDTGALTYLTVFADLNGKYAFDVLDGSYTVYSYWSGNGRIQNRKNIVTPPDATNVDFEAMTVTLSGRVTDANTGDPQTNATVDFYVVGDAPDANWPGVTPLSLRTWDVRGATTVDTNGNFTLSTVMMTTSLVSVTPWVAGYSNTPPRIVTVPTNAAGVDFAVAAPNVNIGVTPAAVVRSVKIGTVVTQSLVIANSGGASMPWTLWQESDEAYQAGTSVRTIPTTDTPEAYSGLAYDGSVLYVYDSFYWTVYLYNATNGVYLGSRDESRNMRLSSGEGLDWDGVNLLSADGNTLYKNIRFVDLTKDLTVKSVPVFQNDAGWPMGVVFGGGYVWMVSNDGRILKADPRTGATLASFAAPGPSGFGGVEYFSGALWVVGSSGKNISKVSPTDGRVIRTFSPSAGNILGLAKDRTGKLWIHDLNNGSPRASLLQVGTAAWMSQSVSTGTVTGGGSNTVQLTLNSTTAGLGVHTAMVSVATSDPDEPEKLVPVTFTVTASQSPVIDAPALATPNPVAVSNTAALSVGAHDPDGDPLVFTWSQVSGPGTATFTPNGTAASSNSVARFSRAGSYVLRVTVSNANANEITTSDVTVAVVGIETEVISVTVPEGSNSLFRARLAAAPPASTTVTVARVTGDTDITVVGGSNLVFDSGNWSAWQTVTLAAAPDTDIECGSAGIALSAAGLATASVSATEQESGTILQALAGSGGTVAPAGRIVVEIGAPVEIIATANPGRFFVRWVCTEGSVVFANPLAPTTTVSVAGAATIRANFGPVSGTAWAWGRNDSYQLGDGTTVTRYAPVQVLSGGQPFTNVTAVAASQWNNYKWSMALRTDGSVWTWGWNNYGQLGDGTTTTRCNPWKVTAISNLVAVSAGSTHSVVLDNRSNVWSWGRNDYGQLGNGTNCYYEVPNPTPVQSLISNVIAIAAGGFHTLALKRDGTVWGWGRNIYGELGDGTSTSRFTAVQAVGLSNITAIAAGSDNSLALRSDGTLWQWGLGGGFPTSPAFTPMQVAISNVVALCAGANHVMAVKADGSVWAWGQNAYGQFGNGALNPLGSAYPPVQTWFSNVVALRAGTDYTLALDGSGGVWGSGNNAYGQLGDGTNVTRITPVKNAGSRDFIAISPGYEHAVAIKENQPYVGVTTSVSSVSVPEGGTNTFQVKLSAQPWTNVTVTVARESGDGDITVTGGTNLVFTSANWSTWQTVTLAAAEDADTSNGTAVIWVSGADFSARVTATEADHDTTPWTEYEKWRHAYFTTAELSNSAVSGDSADPDHDRMFNLDEYLAGTDPTNPVSRLVMYGVAPNPAAPGEFLVTWQSATGKVYTLQAATNLVTGFNLVIGTNLPATPLLNVYTNATATPGPKFYRVLLEQ